MLQWDPADHPSEGYTSQQAAAFTFENSSLSARNSLINCTGSYSANLHMQWLSVSSYHAKKADRM